MFGSAKKLFAIFSKDIVFKSFSLHPKMSKPNALKMGHLNNERKKNRLKKMFGVIDRFYFIASVLFFLFCRLESVRTECLIIVFTTFGCWTELVLTLTKMPLSRKILICYGQTFRINIYVNVCARCAHSLANEPLSHIMNGMEPTSSR